MAVRAIKRVDPDYEGVESSRSLQSSSSDEDDESEPEAPLRHVNIPLASTCYDGTTVALVSFMDVNFVKVHGYGATLLQCLLALCLHIFSIALQLVLVTLLLVTTVSAKEHPFRNVDGMILVLHSRLDVDPRVPLDPNDPLHADTLEDCSVKVPIRNYHLVILFTWVTKMSGEFIDALQRAWIVSNMPLAKDGKLLQLDEEFTDEGGKAAITNVSRMIKVVFALFISLPQFLACAFLTFTGAKFLFYTEDMGTLIMKSIGLSFIVSLDEMMFGAFASLRFQLLVKNTTYRHRTGKPNWHWAMWGTSLAKIVGVSCFASWIYWYAFGKVTELRRLCLLYGETFQEDSPFSQGVWAALAHAFELQTK